MLHIKYRPKTFDEILGHGEVIKSIESLFNKEDKPHSFLLSGNSGCGKTTIARIMSNYLDAEVIELNIANMNGVDFIRELEEKAKYSPLIGKNKAFILDECHQLTKEAGNCLLKILEDSPKHSYFFLCTTEPNKLLLSIRNRCSSYTLKFLSNKEIKQLIQKIINLENIDLSDDILNLLIYKAEGCPRKALVMLDQVKDIKDFESVTKLLADELDKEQDIIDIIKNVIYKKKSWQELMVMFNTISIDNENIRIAFANYLAGCLKNAKTLKDEEKFSDLLSLFLSSLTYGTGKAELIFLLHKAYKL